MEPFRTRLYNLLNPNDRRSRLSNAVNFFIVILINVLGASIETVEGLHRAYGPIFSLIEIFSVLVFTLEYGLRFWTRPESEKYPSRRHFLFSSDSIIDLLAIVPFYLGFLFGINLRVLIALRLLRLLKLIRYFEPLAILGTVMKAEFRAFISAMFVLMILVFIAATGIYFFEKQAQPEVFGSIPQSMWWAIVTLTTLSYGDVVPATVARRVFAALITVMSIGTVALPAGMLASRFSEELRKRKIEYSDHISDLMSDGNLSDSDKEKLKAYREALCLSRDDAEKIMKQIKNNDKPCPTCGRV